MAEKFDYSKLLAHPEWQKKRLQVMKRDKFKCKLCGDKETTLNVHHVKYVYGKNPWEYEMDNFKTLCKHCHLALELCIKMGFKNSFNAKKAYKVMDVIPFIYIEGDYSCVIIKIINDKESIYVIELNYIEYKIIGSILRSI